MDQLQHFSHPHPLLLSLDEYRRFCALCRERVSSRTPCYKCNEDGCKYFYMHISCAELPYQLHHPGHPKHDPLTLMKTNLGDQCDNCRTRQTNLFHQHRSYMYTCSLCKFHLCIQCASFSLTTKVGIHDHPLTLIQKLFQFTCDQCEKEGNGMFYFCVSCSFMVHPECTLLPLVVQPPSIKAEFHDHSMTLARKLISFTCDACGKKGRGMFYFCDVCSFVTHLDCASLPLVVKVIRHEHPLKLISQLPAISPFNFRRCNLCFRMVNIDYMVYDCSSCDYAAHIHCATSKEERDETFVTSMLEHEELRIDESTDILTYNVKRFEPGVDGIKIAAEIKHFSHEHDLKLIDKLGINEKCDACTRYIFTPYYACAQCRFFLHKSCVELKPRIRHVLHEHSLLLLPWTTHDSGCFGCDACGRDCNGFTYNCEECKFNLDVQCISLQYKFTHGSHEHQLIFSRSQDDRKCNNCDSKKILFWCENGEFALDYKCLTLPHSVWYEQHEHPFTLCYAPKDDSGEYYCDICEKERDPWCWFYYCADCLYPAHLECILGEFPNIKFGKTRTIDNHQHPLALAIVSKTSDDGRHLCEVCGYSFTLEAGLAYECAECKFNVHRRCLYKIGTSKG
ncbi:hypothetical protein I3842_07G018900 [Carya illinoinensis]|uniref:Phorbol-ester/DAG-type domain-containing protein n=1 Tax=Carya illinoinensis TaxID=32201 RepID=A0A922EFS1_CARIL|nr:hypothetical protein I3842_07G018900 [Carya illinoinensis]KAG6702131.1 hypothetical protein I3842_07G018900 [Carya illinoinensis]